MNHGQLAGIVTPKDILMRVVAKGLNPENTFVCDIMTPNPDTVLPDMTVVDALREVRTTCNSAHCATIFLKFTHTNTLRILLPTRA